MGDVEVFYAELSSASSCLCTETTNLLTEAAGVQGEDTGIENPAGRASLRLEMHSRLTALHDRAYAKVEAASAVSTAIQQIANSYSDLDSELSGQDGS